MARYTITFLGVAGGFEARTFRDCADDDEVIDLADTLNHPHGIEVRQGQRLVATFQPQIQGPRRIWL